MAIAMTVPGGTRWKQAALVVAHIIGAAVGGACVGILLGAFGTALNLQRFSLPALISVIAIIG
jgi:hypothetical protein